MKRIKIERQKISYSFIFSMAIHFSFLAFMVKVNTENHFVSTNKKILAAAKLEDRGSFESVKIISKKQLQAIKDSMNKQVVANETSGKVERPVDSRFLGEKDQTFERQTLARANGSFKEAGLGKKTGSKSTLAQVKPKVQKIVATPPKKAKKQLTLSDLGGFKLADIEKQPKEVEPTLEDMTKTQAKENVAGAEGVDRGKLGKTGLAQNNDFVEEVPLGDMTNLNTTEFKYYGFYHRIRQKLEQHWGSSIKDKAKNIYRSGRRMPASENLITSVAVTLDETGKIIDMQIEGTSGVRELDQAAIESFNKAGPFPNPPKGLLVGGRATIQWGFVVKS
jgi:TonB family protein